MLDNRLLWRVGQSVLTVAFHLMVLIKTIRKLKG